jgi:hypothetical protein
MKDSKLGHYARGKDTTVLVALQSSIVHMRLTAALLQQSIEIFSTGPANYITPISLFSSI